MKESESRSVVSDFLWPHGILEARILEWVAFPFSRGFSQSRDRTLVSRIVGGFFTSWATKLRRQFISQDIFCKSAIFTWLCEEVKAKTVCVDSLRGPCLPLAALSQEHAFLLLLSLGSVLPVGRASNLAPSPGQMTTGRRVERVPCQGNSRNE